MDCGMFLHFRAAGHTCMESNEGEKTLLVFSTGKVVVVILSFQYQLIWNKAISLIMKSLRSSSHQVNIASSKLPDKKNVSSHSQRSAERHLSSQEIIAI